MKKSNEIEGLFYVSESVRQVYEPKNGAPNGEALKVLGVATVKEYILAAQTETNNSSARKFLVFDQTPETEAAFKVALAGDPEVIKGLRPEISASVPGFVDLLPRPVNPALELGILKRLDQKREQALNNGSH